MRSEKTILEITTTCGICGYSSVRKISIFNLNEFHETCHKFHDDDICLVCYSSTLEERQKRIGLNSLEIDYFYK